jgi:hypothetical protein
MRALIMTLRRGSRCLNATTPARQAGLAWLIWSRSIKVQHLRRLNPSSGTDAIGFIETSDC